MFDHCATASPALLHPAESTRSCAKKKNMNFDAEFTFVAFAFIDISLNSDWCIGTLAQMKATHFVGVHVRNDGTALGQTRPVLHLLSLFPLICS